MFGFDPTSQLPAAAVAVALAGIAALAWGIARGELRSLRVARTRMAAAGERLRELLDRESQKARLLRLDPVSPAANWFDVTLSARDDAATWADSLFARCAGIGAKLQYDAERGHWSAYMPLFEGGPTVAFVVDERDRRRPFEALLAALEIVVADAPPVVDADHPSSSVCVRFSDSAGRWQAYQPCQVCGGGWVDTMFDELEHAALARLTARRLIAGRHEHDDRPAPVPCLYCAMS